MPKGSVRKKRWLRNKRRDPYYTSSRNFPYANMSIPLAGAKEKTPTEPDGGSGGVSEKR